MVLPLDGIRVLDLSTVLAGPLCTMMLGDAGADVVKIERPGGDPARRMGPPFVAEQSAEYLALNRNKRSIVLDLKAPEDVATFKQLCVTADVIVENYRTGVIENLGIGYDEIREINDRIIYCSISGFGRSGPRSDEPAYDAIMQAFVGIMSFTGREGSDPIRVGTSLCDIGAAMYANQAVLLALIAREKTGRGQLVEASLFETQIAWLLHRAVGYFATGASSASKYGAAAPHVVPYDAYPTANGHIVAGALNDNLFLRMMATLGLSEVAADPRFLTNATRVRHRAELTEVLRARFATATTAVWARTLSEGGIPNSPVNSVEDVLNDPQTMARDMIVDLEHPLYGHFKVPGIPIKLNDSPGSIRRPPPALDEHRAEILRELDESLGNAAIDSPVADVDAVAT